MIATEGSQLMHESSSKRPVRKLEEKKAKNPSCKNPSLINNPEFRASTASFPWQARIPAPAIPRLHFPARNSGSFQLFLSDWSIHAFSIRRSSAAWFAGFTASGGSWAGCMVDGWIE